MNTLLLGGVGTAVGTTAILLWRIREGQTPLRKGKIIAPPLGMSTGFCMFFKEEFRYPPEWGLVAFLLGALVFAWPMILTSKLHKENGQIWLKRSPAFFLTILALIAIRLALKQQVQHFITVPQTAGLMFTLAFGMVLHWRTRMLLEFNKLTSE
ncbi:hypothetical protein ABS71_17865 [bacterium SCN 62-11]|nr:cytochrome c biogenesis protein CcdC [Candidatus Eremiobacteraeota bacterium]ODT59449.1 MAG: hypothetical protein ABS71_17865 [bacterium SCN 62-11]